METGDQRRSSRKKIFHGGMVPTRFSTAEDYGKHYQKSQNKFRLMSEQQDDSMYQSGLYSANLENFDNIQSLEPEQLDVLLDIMITHKLNNLPGDLLIENLWYALQAFEEEVDTISNFCVKIQTLNPEKMIYIPSKIGRIYNIGECIKDLKTNDSLEMIKKDNQIEIAKIIHENFVQVPMFDNLDYKGNLYEDIIKQYSFASLYLRDVIEQIYRRYNAKVKTIEDLNMGIARVRKSNLKDM